MACRRSEKSQGDGPAGPRRSTLRKRGYAARNPPHWKRLASIRTRALVMKVAPNLVPVLTSPPIRLCRQSDLSADSRIADYNRELKNRTTGIHDGNTAVRRIFRKDWFARLAQTASRPAWHSPWSYRGSSNSIENCGPYLPSCARRNGLGLKTATRGVKLCDRSFRRQRHERRAPSQTKVVASSAGVPTRSSQACRSSRRDVRYDRQHCDVGLKRCRQSRHC